VIDKMLKRPEILAPCGNMSSLKAAIAAGADACYLAGTSFGARAYADNFSSEELVAAIDLAHLYGVKIYLTCNTLIKNSELRGVYDMLVPLYEAGLDAVLIQDFGIMRLVRDSFPGLDIHTSTQMNILTPEGALLAKSMGASRVVAAREMNIEEIARIKKIAGVEVEAFVHGAMCLCYSGRCLMSSMMGGRSGNRGRCAQPCRQKYNGEYLMSMRDLCSLKFIPEMVDAGIDSLKIEGRMKNEYYTAATVEAYRTLVDEYIDGKFSPERVEYFTSRLLDTFNRGGFSSGYMNRTPKRTESKWDEELIDSSMPGRRGVKMGTVDKISGGKISFKLLKSMERQDELLIDVQEPISITSNIKADAGEYITLNAPETKRIKKGACIYRTRSKELVDYFDGLLSEDKKLCVDIKVEAKIGKKLSITISRDDISVTEEGEVVSEAAKRPIDEATIRSKVSGLGNTRFELGNLDVVLDDNAFIRIGDISNLRRQAIQSMEDAICSKYHRDIDNINDISKVSGYKEYTKERVIRTPLDKNRLVYSFSYPNQLDVFLRKYPQELGAVSGNVIIILDSGLGGYTYDDLRKSIDRLEDFKKDHKNVRIFLGLPYIDRENEWLLGLHNSFARNDSDDLNSVEGLYIRSIDSLALSARLFKDKDFILANSLYMYNDISAPHIADILKAEFGFIGRITVEASLELSLREIGGIDYKTECIMMTYGKIALMVTAGLRDTVGILEDSKGRCVNAIRAENLGYNVVLNDYPLSLRDYDELRESYNKLKFVYFSDETPEEVLDVISGQASYYKKKRYTLGHIEKGI